MAVRTKKTASSQRPSHYNEFVGIVFFALAILSTVSLLSYNAGDWNLSTSSSQETRNWVGPVGSVLADLMFQTVGSMAYPLPALFVLIGFRYMFGKSPRTRITRVLGVMLFVLSGASLLTLLGFYGGIAGAVLYRASSSLVNDIGTGIVFAALLLASLILVTNFSYSSFFESLQMAGNNFRIRFAEWWDRYRKNRAEAAEAKAAEKGTKPAAKPVADKTVASAEPPTISDGSTDLKALNRHSGDLEGAFSVDDSDVFRRLDAPGMLPFGDAAAKAEFAETRSRAAEAGAGAAEGRTSSEMVIPVREVAEQEGKAPESEGERKPASRKPKDLSEYELPSVEFLTEPPPRIEQNDRELLAIADELTEKTKEFNVTGSVKHIGLGPVVTTYEFKPDAGVKYSRVTGLVDDLCLALKAESIRIERVPGKAVVGIEVPNKERETIYLRDVIESEKFTSSESLLSIALGKKIDGARQIADLSKMPHLLIAGATGAGKSVGVNSLIVSILYKARPDQVKFIMVDPKRLELGVYSDIPHLATPIITDPKRASTALRWAVAEMERRYKELAGWGVRNIDGFNVEVKRRNSLKQFDEEGNPHSALPYIVIIIDELADLMMVSGKEVEESITRLAQMARAVGIHLVLATQRPSVDVITGLIKANFPARISFRVSSKIDSRTIIDANGAERLLGKGDMLFLPPATSQLVRVHGAYVDEKEIRKIVDHIKSQAVPEYDETITQSDEDMDEFGDLPGRRDKLFEEALKTVVGSGRASTSLLQRHLRIGYGRAAAILDALVADGFIGDMDSTKRARPVLQKAYEAMQEIEEGREF
jgi:S-DNA-T family DNA segregation ATPase FtsK/SpoIIIE